MNKLILFTSLFLLLFSCGEEAITVQNQNEKFVAGTLETQSIQDCAGSHEEKPPVDILYVVDNSGSTLASSFNSIKSQIKNTILNVSTDFDYHIYIAPLNPGANDDITTYPLIVSDTNSLSNIANLNQVTIDNVDMFAQASGNNQELGFERAKNLILYNRSNGIFRSSANTIIVMISNGDDTQAVITNNSNRTFDETVYSNIKAGFTNMLSSPMNAISLRFISLVAHQTCNGWTKGTTYKRMSKDIYNHQGFSDSPTYDSFDLCGGNYSAIFNAVNASIKAIEVNHKYNYQKISSASEASINSNDITVTKILADKSRVNIPVSATNGFEYIGYKTNQNTMYEPEVGVPKSGLFIKLNGSARITHPECIIAKTVTPTEYFGYISLPREPDLESVKIEIEGTAYPRSTSQGWSYVGYRDTLNIKVPGPTNASVIPANNKSGYFLQLHGNAIFTNGQKVEVFYKPKTN